MENSPPFSDIEQEIPHAVDAERAILGALLLNNELFTEVAVALKAEYFYDKRHQVIYDYMLNLNDAGYVDPLLLASQLRNAGKLADVGSEEYLAELADIGAAPVNARAYADLIRDKAFVRSMLSAHNDSISEGYHPDGKNPPQLLDSAEARLSAVSDKFHRGEGGIQTVKNITRVYEKKIFDNHKDMSVLRGIHPGFNQLYKKTHGLSGGDLIILAGRPGAGKTAFGLNLLRNITQQENTGALCFSLEMSSEQIVMRMLSHHGLDMHKMRSADSVSGTTMGQLASASAELEKHPIYIDDSSSLNILEARTRARRIKRTMEQDGCRLGLIMVDYLQLMEAADTKRSDTRALEVAIISRGLKGLAKELNTPILALSQLNRGSEKRPDSRPMMSDLRESGAIEQDADLILFLHAKNENQQQETTSRPPVQLIIGKQRNGPTGVIELEFDKPLSLFHETGSTASESESADDVF